MAHGRLSLIALAAVALATLSACGDGTRTDGRASAVETARATPATRPLATARIVTPPAQLPAARPTAGAVPPGTFALFDIAARTAKKLDLGRSLVLADWIDDGKTLLALDVNAHAYVALRLDGTLVREIAKESSAGESFPDPYPVVVHDGRHVALLHLTAGALDLVDVVSGETETVAGGALVAGIFSPDGTSLAGGVAPKDEHGAADRANAIQGVFSLNEQCKAALVGEGAAPAQVPCALWKFPQEPGFRRGVAAREPWSPDGTHLLLANMQACPDAPTGTPSPPCSPDATFEVYSWPAQERVLTLYAGQDGEASWAGNNALYVRGIPDASTNASDHLVSLDGKSSTLPADLRGCCLSLSPDGRLVVASAVPGEDCSLIDVATGAVIAGVPKGAADTNDTGICQHVSWTPDGAYAIATGVSTP